MIPLLIYLIRSYILKKKNAPGKLFAQALENENSGQYEAAVVSYENALVAVKKNRFNNNGMKNKIVEKLKVLHTVIDYKNNFHFGK